MAGRQSVDLRTQGFGDPDGRRSTAQILVGCYGLEPPIPKATGLQPIFHPTGETPQSWLGWSELNRLSPVYKTGALTA